MSSPDDTATDQERRVPSRPQFVKFRPDDPARMESDSAAQYAQRLLRECGLGGERVLPRTASFAAIDWARSGAMSLTGESGSPPRFAAGPLATAARGCGLALQHLAPTREILEIDAAALLGERAAIANLSRNGRTSPGGSARLLPTLDGWIAVNLPRPDDWRLAHAWLGPHETTPPAEDWDSLGRQVSARTSAELLERGRLLGMAVADTPRTIDTARPWFRREAATTTIATTSLARRIRVLDLTSLWAGPLATSLLAMSGVEVLKIENPDRPDGARHGPPAFFDLMNQDKDGCALDLKSSRDRRVFDELLEETDIVFESSRPRGLEQLGYSASEWATARPGRLWVSITGYGRTEPERNWVAFGDDAATAAGLGWPPSVGVDDPTPCFCADAIADPLTGLHAAVFALGHLLAGRGGILDISLVDICARAASLPVNAESDVPSSIERDDSGEFAVVGEHRASIAAPRARTPHGDAPPLQILSEEARAKWISPC